MKNKILVLLLIFLTSILWAQSSSSTLNATTPSPTTTPAKEDDVRSIDSILAATYDVISGPAGKKRDWDRFRSLFYPGARLIPTGRRPNETEVRARVLSPDDYVERSAAFVEKEGFFERGISSKIEKFGNIAQVFSTYESRHNAGDAQPFQRGINSFQLVNDGKRWWIMTIMWEAETPENPIPKGT
jgi:hypothetical protein